MSTDKKRIPMTQQAPAMRRVLEVVRRLDLELACWEYKETAAPSEADRRERGRGRSLELEAAMTLLLVSLFVSTCLALLAVALTDDDRFGMA